MLCAGRLCSPFSVGCGSGRAGLWAVCGLWVAVSALCGLCGLLVGSIGSVCCGLCSVASVGLWVAVWPLCCAVASVSPLSALCRLYGLWSPLSGCGSPLCRLYGLCRLCVVTLSSPKTPIWARDQKHAIWAREPLDAKTHHSPPRPDRLIGGLWSVGCGLLTEHRLPISD